MGNYRAVQKEPLQTIAAYLRFHWVLLNKLQGKAATPTEKLEWWIILMVDCVSLAEYVQRPVCFVNVQSSLHEMFVRACAMPRMLYLSCGNPFPV